MVTPDIHDIVKKSLSIGKYLMFYLPRNIDINELGEIIYAVTGNQHIYLDVHLLESANKLKAILLIYGGEAQTIINKLDISFFLDYLNDSKNFSNDKLNKSFENEEDNGLILITKLLRKNGNEKEKFIIEKGISPNKSFIKDKDKEVKENLILNGYQPLNNPAKLLLIKIFSLIGPNNFFDGLLKYKEKYIGLTNESYNSLNGKLKLKELSNYFLKELLTDKQLSRLN